MKTIKEKLVAFVGGLGALCVLCCTLPILGLVGLGTYEAIFCENTTLQIGGAVLAVGAVVYLIHRKLKRSCGSNNVCSTNCACKAA